MTIFQCCYSSVTLNWIYLWAVDKRRHLRTSSDALVNIFHRFLTLISRSIKKIIDRLVSDKNNRPDVDEFHRTNGVASNLKTEKQYAPTLGTKTQRLGTIFR